MDSPFVLVVLLALPFAVGAVIIAVSSVRRRQAAADGPGSEPRHRGQADTAAAQTAAAHPEPAGRKYRAGRSRRADSAE